MSKYYDPDKPYSIENWNLLVRDVNEILENPPEGSTNCDPIEALEEVEDPHIWAVADITNMREKLKETCPDIVFIEETVLWKTKIIDEIETQMEEAWCDCETEPEEKDIEVCSFSQTAVIAAYNETRSGGYVDETAPCLVACIGDHCHETQYDAPWYSSPRDANDGKSATIFDSYAAAYSAVWSFVGYMNRLPAIGRDITEYQRQVDNYVSEIDTLIEQYESECLGESPMPSQCGNIVAQICSKGQAARQKQDKVDENVEDFAKWYNLAMPELATANSQAATNSSTAMSLEGRFPTDHNVYAECYAAAVPSWPWYDYWDPSTMDQLGDLLDWFYNIASNGNGVFVRVHAYYANTNTPWYVWDITIRLSPNGTPFLSDWAARRLNQSYSKTYQNVKDRWRREQEPNRCSWDPWSESEKVWWDQGWPGDSCGAFQCWIWAPLPEPDFGDFGSDKYSLYTKKDGSLKDQTEKRDKWLDDYNNWYAEHEQYDDRHESYC